MLSLHCVKWACVAEHRLSVAAEWGLSCPMVAKSWTRLSAHTHMWDLSFQTRDQTCIPCIGRQILKHWTTREVLPINFLFLEPFLPDLLILLSLDWLLPLCSEISPHHVPSILFPSLFPYIPWFLNFISSSLFTPLFRRNISFTLCWEKLVGKWIFGELSFLEISSLHPLVQ